MSHPLSRHESLVRHAGYGIFVASVEGRFTEVNPALVRMLGYDREEELLSVSLAREVYLDPAELERPPSRSGEPGDVDWIETRWRKRDDTPITVRIALRTVLDEDARAASYEGIVEDVTETRRHEELLRRSERMASIGTTLAGVAHELNNPLAAIMGFSQWLMKKSWPEEDRTALETISHEAERSAKIVKDLLMLARRREAERRTPVNVNDVVGYIVRTRRYALRSAGITCELSLSPALPLVCGDRAQLEQVVLNLVNNAEQALRAARDADSRRGSRELRIEVRTHREGSAVLLAVDDNGPGIPEGARSRIWDPFWTTRDEGEGTGLGLSVVHHIVVEHGGTVDVDRSRFEEGGASFRVRLPALVRLDGAGEPDEGLPAARALDVLVVATDPTDRSFLTRFLTSRGHVVLAAPGADRARRLAEHTAFDAVVLDVGLSAAARTWVDALRTSPGCARARFVVCGTESPAAGEEESRPPERPAGVPADATFVARPYDVDLLRRAVEEV